MNFKKNYKLNREDKSLSGFKIDENNEFTSFFEKHKNTLTRLDLNFPL